MNLVGVNVRYLPCRRLSVSAMVLGGVKVRRKKQAMRVDNPHLPAKKEKTAKTLALANFDQYYSQFYGVRWPSIRLALLSRSKYCAVVNNYGDPEVTTAQLEALGCSNIADLFNAKNKTRLTRYDPVESIIEPISKHSEESVNNIKVREIDKDSDEDLEPDYSLNAESAIGRYIDADEKVIGDAAASMYDFVPTNKLKGMEDFVEESEYYDYYQKVNSDSVPVVKCDNIIIPKHLKLYTFPRNVMDRFDPPSAGPSGNLNYYCLDGGSIFPVLALDIRPGQNVLDMCAAPGGKSLVALQTLFPFNLVANDINFERLKRLRGVMEQYLGPGSGFGDVLKSVDFSRSCGKELLDYGVYDRVLLDAPCFSDRHSVASDHQNLFAQQMIKDRIKLPEQQCELLKAGLLYLKPGGSLVYSTCTLSPVQNEGVVNMALKALWEETANEYYVNDLTDALKPFRFMCRIFGAKQGISLGNLIVPNISNNFGPIYFCKITRKS